MSERGRRWEEWKRGQVEAAPRRGRAALRRLLADVPPPTAAQERAMKELRKLVEEVFGGSGARPAKGKKRKGRT